MVVDLFKFIHPHFSCPDTVGQSLLAGVRSLLGENVANVRTRVYLQGPTALPDLHAEQSRGWGGRAGIRSRCPMPDARRPDTEVLTNAAKPSPFVGQEATCRHTRNTECGQRKKADPRQTGPQIHALKLMHLSHRGSHRGPRGGPVYS